MSKTLKVPLSDGTIYAINPDQLVSSYVGSATSFYANLVNPATVVTFVHESDPNNLCHMAFLSALGSCNSAKSNPSASITMDIPDGFTVELG